MIFKLFLLIGFMSNSCEEALMWMAQNNFDVNIGSGDGLLLSGNIPLPEPMLTKIYATYGVTKPQWIKQVFFIQTFFK